MKLYEVTTIAAATAKAQNIEYFATDLDPRSVQGEGSVKWTVTLAGTAVDVEVTLDSGTTWVILDSGLTARTITEHSFNVRDTDAVNFRTANASGITLDLFRIDATI